MEAKELIIQRFKDSIEVKEQNIKDDELVSAVPLCPPEKHRAGDFPAR